MLMNDRNVRGLGVDSLSIDLMNDSTFPVHNAWLPSGRWGVEAMANLGELPEVGAYLVVGGPKIKGATGGPSRLIALTAT
jgi:kynurenine formamidase